MDPLNTSNRATCNIKAILEEAASMGQVLVVVGGRKVTSSGCVNIDLNYSIALIT